MSTASQIPVLDPSQVEIEQPQKSTRTPQVPSLDPSQVEIEKPAQPSSIGEPHSYRYARYADYRSPEDFNDPNIDDERFGGAYMRNIMRNVYSRPEPENVAKSRLAAEKAESNQGFLGKHFGELPPESQAYESVAEGYRQTLQNEIERQRVRVAGGVPHFNPITGSYIQNPIQQEEIGNIEKEQGEIGQREPYMRELTAPSTMLKFGVEGISPVGDPIEASGIKGYPKLAMETYRTARAPTQQEAYQHASKAVGGLAETLNPLLYTEAGIKPSNIVKYQIGQELAGGAAEIIAEKMGASPEAQEFVKATSGLLGGVGLGLHERLSGGRAIKEAQNLLKSNADLLEQAYQSNEEFKDAVDKQDWRRAAAIFNPMLEARLTAHAKLEGIASEPTAKPEEIPHLSADQVEVEKPPAQEKPGIAQTKFRLPKNAAVAKVDNPITRTNFRTVNIEGQNYAYDTRRTNANEVKQAVASGELWKLTGEQPPPEVEQRAAIEAKAPPIEEQPAEKPVDLKPEEVEVEKSRPSLIQKPTYAGPERRNSRGPETSRIGEYRQELLTERDPQRRAELQQAIERESAIARGEQPQPGPEHETEGITAEEVNKRALENVPEQDNAPTPGTAGQVATKDLNFDPRRFQYKTNVNERGVTNLLAGKRYNPELAGEISVWRDPADGKLYVINGHHRAQLAVDSGQQNMRAWHIDVSTAEAARARGALQNIADGRGTAVDAAKFFRDSGMTSKDLDVEGISLGEATASNGLALSRLDPSVFEKVATGQMTEARGVAIGEATADAAQQEAIVKLIEKQEARGRRITNDTISELARFVANSGNRTVEQGGLFGSNQEIHSLALEKAEASAYIKQQIAKERRTFAAVATQDRAQTLSQVKGQQIKATENAKISQDAAQAEEAYNKLSSSVGPVSNILEKAARDLASGNYKPEDIKRMAYQSVREEIRKTLSGGQEGSTEGLQGPEQPVYSKEEPRPVVPTFFSKAERVAEQKLPNNISADSVIATLKNAGVKDEELKWMGLDDFLKGKDKVSKQEVMDFIRQNNVQVQEIKRGEYTPEAIATSEKLDALQGDINKARNQAFRADEQDDNWNQTERANARNWAIQAADGQAESANKINALDISPERKAAIFEYGRLAAQSHELNEQVIAARDRENTKFHDHQLPGGENYRELLLTLPRTGKQPLDFQSWTIRRSAGDMALTNDVSREAYDRELKAGKVPQVDVGSNVYQSGHFKEPNVLAHVRFNDRTDADGKKVLFVEELQSDWHQKGRRQGYQPAGSERATLEAQLKEAEDAHSKTADARHEALENFKYRDSYHPEAFDEADRANNAAFAKVKELRGKLNSGVPDAPFKSTWHELALKRMLRYAAENGYDRVAWTTGDVQNERYDLSKQVNSIEWYWNDRKAGTKIIRIAPKEGNVIELGLQPDGTATGVSGGRSGTEFDGKHITDIVGKDIGQKITTDSHGELSGDGLKVGGSGMKGFYDKIIPDFLNKYGKKWGARAGETSIPAGERQMPTAGDLSALRSKFTNDTEAIKLIDRAESFMQADHRSGQSGFGNILNAARQPMYHFEPRDPLPPGDDGAFLKFDTVDRVKKAAEELPARRPSLPAHSLDITPSMRDSVMHEGQPMFAKEWGTGMAPGELDNWIKAAGKNLRVEERGEQNTLFGAADKMYQITNQHGERTVITESQLKSLSQKFPNLASQSRGVVAGPHNVTWDYQPPEAKSLFRPQGGTPTLAISREARNMIVDATKGMEDFRGTNLTADQVRKIAEKVATVQGEYRQVGQQLSQAMMKAADDAGNSGVHLILEDAPERVTREEQFHGELQRELGEGEIHRHLPEEAATRLLEHPAAAKLADELTAKGYSKDAPGWVKVAEISAKIATGDLGQLSPAEAADWFDNYLSELHQAHGEQKVSNLVEVLHQKTQDIYNEARQRINARESQTRPGPGEGEGRLPQTERSLRDRQQTGPPQEAAGRGNQENGKGTPENSSVEEPLFSKDPNANLAKIKRVEEERERGSAPLVPEAYRAIRKTITDAGKLGELYTGAVDKLLEYFNVGKPHPEIRQFDPDAADLALRVDAGGQYHKATSQYIAKKVVGAMAEDFKPSDTEEQRAEKNRITRDRMKGFFSLADVQNREYAQEHHPEDYHRWLSDPRIARAVTEYQPFMEDLRNAVKQLGGKTIDEDYIKRVMDFATGGIDQPTVTGQKSGAGRDYVIGPQVDRSKARKDNGDFYWKHGVFDFGPSFEKRWIEVMSKLDEHRLAVHTMARGTRLEAGDQQPAKIYYNGQEFYRPDIAKEIEEVQKRGPSPESKRLADELGVSELPAPKKVQQYAIYEPLKGSRFENAAKNLASQVFAGAEADKLKASAGQVTQMANLRYAVPKEIADVLQHYRPDVGKFSKMATKVLGPVTQLIRQQIIGLAYGIPHMGNILRKVMQSTPGSVLNPKAYANAWKVAFSKELKARAISGPEDPGFDSLLRNAGISEGAIPDYKHYIEGNFDLKSWDGIQESAKTATNAFREGGRAEGKVTVKSALAGIPRLAIEPLNRFSEAGHHNLFKPGGIDQRARLWLHDFLANRRPDMDEADRANAVNETLGRYNRASWTDVQKGIAPFMLFPGWDYSSISFALKHPFKTAVAPAVLIFLANQLTNALGGNQQKDKNDLTRLHFGRYSVTSNLIGDNMGRHMWGWALRGGQAILDRKRPREVTGEMTRGLPGDVAGVSTGTMNPIISAATSIGFNRMRPGANPEIAPKGDYGKRGRIPGLSKATEDYGGYALRKGFPIYDMLHPEGNTPWFAAAGRVGGVNITKEQKKKR